MLTTHPGKPRAATRLAALLAAFLPGTGDPPPLERALESVSSDSICADVRFIACDELEGRDTPSQGLRLAARYLRARLERLGFQPMGDRGWFDEYRLLSRAMDLERSSVTLTRDDVAGETRLETRLVYGRDCLAFGSGVSEHDLSGPATYVGTGTPEEFAKVELDGRWAVVVASEQVSYFERSRNARETGAIGVVTLADPAAASGNEWWRGMEMRRARVEGAEERRSGSSQPQLFLTPAGTQALLGMPSLPAAGTPFAFTLHDRRVLAPEQAEVLENVCAFWPGSDPELAKEVIVLSAHYDHVGKQGGEIHNGADDNGSGTSGLLAVAEALASYGPMRRSVLFLWVSGEEKGLWGSGAWTRQPTLPEGHRAVCNLNVDMIGRNAPGQLLVTPSQALPEYNGLTRLAEELAPLEGFPALGAADEFWRRSDHVNFAVNLAIPVVFLFSGEHEDYHKPGDDAEKIDCDKIGRVARLLVRLLERLQGDELGV